MTDIAKDEAIDFRALDQRFALADGKLVYCVECGMVMPEVWPLMDAHLCPPTKR